MTAHKAVVIIRLLELGHSPNDRVHFMTRAKRTKAVRDMAFATTRQKLGSLRIERETPLALTYSVCWPNGRRRRDADNLLGSLKPVGDGICDALGITDANVTLLPPEQQTHTGPGLMLEVFARLAWETP